RAFKKRHSVDVGAWCEGSGRSRDQASRTDRPRVRALIRTQIDAQPCIDSRLAVPGERIEIVLHGVKTIEARLSLDGATDIGLAGDDIFVLKPSADHRFMMIDQRPLGPFIAPVRALANDDAQVEFVVSEHALPGWVLAQK